MKNIFGIIIVIIGVILVLLRIGKGEVEIEDCLLIIAGLLLLN